MHLVVSPNYQVQRRATAALARGRDSDRVRDEAERPRHALYVSPVRCNAELGARALWLLTYLIGGACIQRFELAPPIVKGASVAAVVPHAL
jgi:hypothetical protein